MPNVVKYSLTAQANTLKKGNVVLGMNSVEYGPTSATGFWNGIEVPAGGYAMYIPYSNGTGMSIYSIANDAQLINVVNQIGLQNFTTASQALTWTGQQTGLFLVNREYENIVTDGLILNLDAGFTPSYPKSGTTWYDVSGTNNGTLTNGPTFSSNDGGSIVFDGTDDYAPITSNIFAVGNGNFTLEAWCYRNPTANEFSGIIASTTIGNINGIALTDRTCWIGTSSTSQAIGNNSIKNFNDNVWFYASFRRSDFGTTLSLKINGVDRFTPVTFGSPTFVGGETFHIGQRYNNNSSFPWKGNIANIKFYDKDLSDEEILQNFNAQKGRFGL
jgi:hypothetical protein